MKDSKQYLTLAQLTEEWATWYNQFGEKRNNEDLRFGQYIWSKYLLADLFEGDVNDGFYEEQTSKAFKTIYSQIVLKDLKKQTETNNI